MVLQLTLFLFFFWFVSCYCFYYLLRFFFLFFNSCACDHSQYPEIRPAWSLLSPESSLLSPESSRIWLLSLITIANGGFYLNLILFWPGWYAAGFIFHWQSLAPSDDCEWMGFSHLVLWGCHYHTPNLKCSNLISRLQNNNRCFRNAWTNACASC
ncbi:uncharacterized protein LOC105767534 isoform X5 [Gossypium raimondii]|uniref:uncharacterized protein LOC105767534 isoform X5 n=1 Tax=Gossypium raimondii TaxID=29730 RepID=UPI00227A7C0C|nr:uncharacterized protein LOC105767534 isoform X5 [Gossypium raimondii]XP_052487525.1 uncharacterized protein LOC105767534 isoform X5 [Gossypium raimondii]